MVRRFQGTSTYFTLNQEARGYIEQLFLYNQSTKCLISAQTLIIKQVTKSISYLKPVTKTQPHNSTTLPLCSITLILRASSDTFVRRVTTWILPTWTHDTRVSINLEPLKLIVSQRLTLKRGPLKSTQTTTVSVYKTHRPVEHLDYQGRTQQKEHYRTTIYHLIDKLYHTLGQGSLIEHQAINTSLLTFSLPSRVTSFDGYACNCNYIASTTRHLYIDR